MLNPTHLRTFVDVMKTGSFALTARHLDYTASAVSQQISALERRSQVRLFERDARGIRSTAAAQYLLSEAQEALGALQAITDKFTEVAAGKAGPLRIGSFPTASQRLVPTVLTVMKDHHPGVQIHLDEGEPSELVSMIRMQELDVAIIYRYEADPVRFRDLEIEHHLLTEDLMLAVPSTHPLSNVQKAPLEALREDWWITTRKGTAGVFVLEQLCHAAGFSPSIIHQSNDYAVIQGLVAAGLGIALIPALGVIRLPGVQLLSLDAPNTRRHVLAALSPSSHGEALSALLNQLRMSAYALTDIEPNLARPPDDEPLKPETP